LKEFNHRWYLVGEDIEKQTIRIFGLDRVLSLDITNRKFEPAIFDVAAYFYHCFGIIRPDEETVKPARVVLSMTPFKGRYFKSLPLHLTQEVLIDNEQETGVGL
jgi:hypothetical protein